MRLTIPWHCPYCGCDKNRSTLQVPGPSHHHAYCDLEEGGCDRLVSIKTTITAHAEARKIEGE